MKTKKSYVPKVGIDVIPIFGDVRFTQPPKELYIKGYKVEEWISSCIETITYACVNAGYHLRPRYSDTADEFYCVLIRKFFDNINEEDILDDLLYSTCFDLLTYGNAFWELVLDEQLIIEFNEIKKARNIQRVIFGDWKFPFRYYRVPPQNIQIKLEYGIKKFYIKTQLGEFEPIDPEFIVHFKLHSPIADIEGVPPLATLKNAVAALIFANEYNINFFENNATPRLHIDLGNVSKKAMEDFIGMAEKKLKGKPHANIITRGNTKVTPITWRNIDMEFVRYLEHLRDKVFSKFKIPPLIMGVVERGGNAEAQIALFKALAVKPIQKIIESRINRRILRKHFPEADIWYEFNVVDNLDQKQQTDIDASELASLITTINEVRLKRGQKKVTWGDTPVIPYSDLSKARLVVKEEGKKKNV